jgi:hypothetical protein
MLAEEFPEVLRVVGVLPLLLLFAMGSLVQINPSGVGAHLELIRCRIVKHQASGRRRNGVPLGAGHARREESLGRAGHIERGLGVGGGRAEAPAPVVTTFCAAKFGDTLLPAIAAVADTSALTMLLMVGTAAEFILAGVTTSPETHTYPAVVVAILCCSFD